MIYQLVDTDGEPVMLIETDCPADELAELWEEFYNSGWEDVDEFFNLMAEEQWPEAERLYVSDIIYPGAAL